MATTESREGEAWAYLGWGCLLWIVLTFLVGFVVTLRWGLRPLGIEAPFG